MNHLSLGLSWTSLTHCLLLLIILEINFWFKIIRESYQNVEIIFSWSQFAVNEVHHSRRSIKILSVFRIENDSMQFVNENFFYMNWICCILIFLHVIWFFLHYSWVGIDWIEIAKNSSKSAINFDLKPFSKIPLLTNCHSRFPNLFFLLFTHLFLSHE